MEDENEDIHGNSKESKKLQHLYAIWNNFYNFVYKYGISGSKLNKDGSSKRANNQVNKLNKEEGENSFSAEIIEKEINGRANAIEKEKKIVSKYQTENDDAMPSGQIRPDKRKKKKK